MCDFPFVKKKMMVILFREHDEMEQEGVSRGTVTTLAEQRILRVTLLPNSMPLNPGINRFQILALIVDLFVFMDIQKPRSYKYLAAKN